MAGRPKSPVPGPSRPIDDAQRLAWLRLIRSESVGPITHRELINHFGGAVEAIAALPDLARRGGRRQPVRVFPADQAAAEIDAAGRAGARLVTAGDHGYPPWLWEAHAAPPILYIRGRPELAHAPVVAVVGARNASAAGQKLARLIAGGLGEQAIVVASGLARGIDAAAHRAALERGTIAVLAGGVDVVYPPEHAELQDAIGSHGLLITERPPGLEPRAQDFPRRNRIVAGMAAGVVIIEAARRSGSLITARLANEIGREVFAVPGNPLDPRAEGTNGLIRAGATLVTSSADVLEVLAPILGRKVPEPEPEAPPQRAPDPASLSVPEDARRSVIEALGPHPVEIDEIARATGVPIRTVRVILIELDLAGRIERHPGHLVSLRP